MQVLFSKFLMAVLAFGMVFGMAGQAQAAMEIQNVEVVPGPASLGVTWTTTEPSTWRVTLLDQNVASYRPSLASTKAETKHVAHFKNVVDTTIVVQIDATSASGEKVTYKSEPVVVVAADGSSQSGTTQSGQATEFTLEDIGIQTFPDSGETIISWQTTLQGDSRARIYHTESGFDERRDTQEPIRDHILIFQNLPTGVELTLEVSSTGKLAGEEDSFTGTFTVEDTIGAPLALKGDLQTDIPRPSEPPLSGGDDVDGFDGNDHIDDAGYGPIQEYFSATALAGTALAMSRAALFNWIALLALGFAALVEGYFFFKRRRLWGVVYDARTKKPVEMAVVRLFDQEHHKLLETRVTPQSGRFSFLAEPGHEYYLDVTREGYHFPTRIVTGKIDNEYTNIYRGEVIKLGAGQSLVAPDVPIDGEGGEVKALSAWRKIVIPLLDTIRLPLLIVLVVALFFTDMVIELEAGPDAILMLIVAGVLLFIELLFTRRGRR